MTAGDVRTGQTAPGRTAAQPDGIYAAPQRIAAGPDGMLTVDFHGRDGRSRVYRLDDLPLVGWHADMATA